MIENFLVNELMVEIEPLLTRWLKLFEQCPKVF
jgi:hypothetical protein